MAFGSAQIAINHTAGFPQSTQYLYQCLPFSLSLDLEEINCDPEDEEEVKNEDGESVI